MSNRNNTPGLGHVPEYQASSWPWVTSSIIASDGDVHEHNFPYVTRWLILHNKDHGGSSELSFGFTANGVTGSNNYFSLHAGEMSPRLELKCKKIFITADTNSTPYEILAGYTAISADLFPVLTGSSGWEGVG